MEREKKVTGLNEKDIYGNSSAFTFVAGVTRNLMLLATGCTDYVVPADARVNLNRLSDFFAAKNVTITFMAPAMLPYFRQKKKTLRLVMIAGERAVKVWSDEFEIVNGYGLSESCSFLTGFVLDKAYDNAPLGKPVGDAHAYILDENGNEADEGEMCFTGHFASGYLNLPEKTAEVFVPNPFKDRDGFEMMLRTGDIGRCLKDGNLLYLGRKDWMVNINGQRVEPEEISSVMMSMGGVTNAAVRDFTGSDGQVFLCAY